MNTWGCVIEDKIEPTYVELEPRITVVHRPVNYIYIYIHSMLVIISYYTPKSYVAGL